MTDSAETAILNSKCICRVQSSGLTVKFISGLRAALGPFECSIQYELCSEIKMVGE
jgi:hypothetical protein